MLEASASYRFRHRQSSLSANTSAVVKVLAEVSSAARNDGWPGRQQTLIPRPLRRRPGKNHQRPDGERTGPAEVGGFEKASSQQTGNILLIRAVLIRRYRSREWRLSSPPRCSKQPPLPSARGLSSQSTPATKSCAGGTIQHRPRHCGGLLEGAVGARPNFGARQD